MFVQYGNDDARLFGEPNNLENEEFANPNEESAEPFSEDDFFVPPEVDQRHFDLHDPEENDIDDRIEHEQDEEIINIDDRPDSPELGRVFSSQNQDRPRRGCAYNNADASFMKGRYIILNANPVDGQDRNRTFECCLCQAMISIEFV